MLFWLPFFVSPNPVGFGRLTAVMEILIAFLVAQLAEGQERLEFNRLPMKINVTSRNEDKTVRLLPIESKTSPQKHVLSVFYHPI